MSNMKQLGLGLLMYAQDYDGRIVPYNYTPPGGTATGTWGKLYTPLIDYVKADGIFRCPSSPKRSVADAPFTSFQGSTYGFPNKNVASSGWAAMATGTAFPLASAPEASRTVLLGETMWNPYYDRFGYGSAQFPVANPMKIYTTETGYHLNGERHLGGSNFLYVDGHVKWHKVEAIASAIAASNSGGCAPIASPPNVAAIFCWQ